MNTRIITLGALLSAGLIGGLPAAAAQTSDQPQEQSAPAEKGKVKDPVCGMTIDPKTAAGKAEYKGKTYYFCSRDDQEKFEKAPEKYVKEGRRP